MNRQEAQIRRKVQKAVAMLNKLPAEEAMYEMKHIEEISVEDGGPTPPGVRIITLEGHPAPHVPGMERIMIKISPRLDAIAVKYIPVRKVKI